MDRLEGTCGQRACRLRPRRTLASQQRDLAGTRSRKNNRIRVTSSDAESKRVWVTTVTLVRSRVSKGTQSMTIGNRMVVAVAALAFSLGVTLAPAAFAEDQGKKDAMSHSTQAKDSMSKDAMSKDAMGKDSMKKDETKK
jgi:pentapeptide MXKDX repeat protein